MSQQPISIAHSTDPLVIYVGSKNPAKLEAVAQGLAEYHPRDSFVIVVHEITNVEESHSPVIGQQIRLVKELAPRVNNTDQTASSLKHTIIGLEVASDVSSQPFSASETLTGARNRAKNLLALISNSKQIQVNTSSLIDQNLLNFDFVVGIEGGVESVDDIYLESGYIAVIDRNGVQNVGTSARFEVAPHIIKKIQSGLELSEIIDEIAGATDLRSSSGFMGVITQDLLTRIRAYKHGTMFAFAKWESPAKWWVE